MQNTSSADSPIAVTILCGFLGSGKTTLLKKILTSSHGQKIAVIENEFGAENIDNEILSNDNKNEIVQMSNGCLCCSIRGDLQKTLLDLLAKKDSKQLDFDKVVIEASGVAEPGPIAQTFFLDPEINVKYRLDAVISLVDSVHATQHLDEHVQIQQQIGFADKILLTKTDIADAEKINNLRKRIIKINPKAPILLSTNGVIDLENIFNLKGFNLDDKLDIDPNFLKAEEEHHHDENCHDEHCTHEHHDHEHKHEHKHEHHHHESKHDHQHTKHKVDSIQSFVYQSNKPFIYKKLEDFLSAILSVYGDKLLRYKGVLYMKDVEKKVVLQGVHQIMGSDIGPMWIGKPKSKIVFIGKDLPQEIIMQGLEMCHE